MEIDCQCTITCSLRFEVGLIAEKEEPMSNFDPLAIRAALSRIFQQKGGPGEYTKLFEDFDPFTQDILVEYARLKAGEIPVIGRFRDNKDWLLITTERVLWMDKEKEWAVGIPMISSVVPTEFGLERKAEMSALKIKADNGFEGDLHVDTGLPFSGIWNVLTNIVARNRKPQGERGSGDS